MFRKCPKHSFFCGISSEMANAFGLSNLLWFFIGKAVNTVLNGTWPDQTELGDEWFEFSETQEETDF